MRQIPARTTESGYVAVESAVKVAAISARTLRCWIASGELPATGGKRGRLVRLADVEALAALTGRTNGNGNLPADSAEATFGNVAESPTLTAIERQLAEYRDMIERWHAENVSLAGRVRKALEDARATTRQMQAPTSPIGETLSAPAFHRSSPAENRANFNVQGEGRQVSISNAAERPLERENCRVPSRPASAPGFARSEAYPAAPVAVLAVGSAAGLVNDFKHLAGCWRCCAAGLGRLITSLIQGCFGRSQLLLGFPEAQGDSLAGLAINEQVHLPAAIHL